jgi:CheY-like chemotaxis protein
VEDEPAVLNLVAEILTRAGCRVITAGTGDEALARFEEHPEIEVLLSDVVMPGINGPELAERLRLRNRTLPVIFMSGYSGEALGGRGIVAEADVIKKPFTATELIHAVRRSTVQIADLAA